MPDDAEKPVAAKPPEGAPSPAGQALGSATYEIIRQRLQTQGTALRERMRQLDARRREVFGAIDFKLLQADRIITSHNCVPQAMIQLGHGCFLFAFNVQFGLKKEIELADVFAVYHRDEETGSFKEGSLEVLQDQRFVTDFKRLYNVYEKTTFRRFSVVDGMLYMVFSIGPGVEDISVFKWAFNDGQIRFLDGRAESEFRRVGLPPTHEFRWLTPDRESFRYGDHPHLSIADRVFVDCIGGDLTIKVEDNTATGEGILSEPVEDRHQKVDDAEVAYALVGHLVLLKIRPYKEEQARYFIFNEKLQEAVRVDAIGTSCRLLPEDHGLIFPDGYYLSTGELKLFEATRPGMRFDRVIQSPNGEDSLFVFYHRSTGEYVLLPYRLIPQKVEERITCHGFTLFPNGHLIVFRAEPAPQKHHMIQLRQTPFHQPGHEPPGQREAFLYQVGNKDVVRCLAECNEVLTLVGKDQPYAELYTDLVARCGAILDAYPWLSHAESFGLNEALAQVREAADKAVDEFDKVRRLQAEAVQRVRAIHKRCEERIQGIHRARFTALRDYVDNLAALRQLRGELITLKEVRYVDLDQIASIETAVAAENGKLSGECVRYLLDPQSLEPYRTRAGEQLAAAEAVETAAKGRELEKETARAGAELEMLIEIVNSLNIQDATETTRIIDAITAVYATLNQVKAAIKKRLQALVASEGAAQFGAQMKLLGQSAASYLDLCDTPAKCDDYLNRISVQLEELEGAFADFEDYTVQLAERRTELYEAFEQRKQALVEQRNRKAQALLTAAGRILKAIQNRLAGFKAIDEINAYMASDQMITKVRDIIAQLLAIEDSVKADDLQGQLKSAQQEAVRQLKDRQELFTAGDGVIRFGRHHFNVNTQPLDLTVVPRDGTPSFHLTGTKYFDPIVDEAFLATRDVWDQELVSENGEVYRAEYLAHRLCQSWRQEGRDLAALAGMAEPERLALVQNFMSGRYQEGYTKGIHDLDAARILEALCATHVALRLTRHPPTARACAMVFWHRFCPEATRSLWSAKLQGFAERNRLFPGDPEQQLYITSLRALVAGFAEETGLYDASVTGDAGAYLFHQIVSGGPFALSREADQCVTSFRQHLAAKGSEQTLAEARQALAQHQASELELIRDWVRGFLLSRPEFGRFREEAAAILFCAGPASSKGKLPTGVLALEASPVEAESGRALEGMKGNHAMVEGSRYTFDYLAFQEKLRRFEREVVPRFESYHRVKQSLIERERERLRLDEFKPRVLTSFVRNQLIDEVYLPMVGDNLAKQIGAAGDQKRTDLMGLLLVISPPGYGKTTLMEYIANRLGIVFIKINGPAIGHGVTSLDPEDAPNAAAREEIQKLNLSFEMGDNAMIYLDDIQHCNPEFLQKFISLCDAQRKVEGVWRGRSRTYDLRGRKVAVVMAGNPYTESGTKFRIPDMLANRADTYNLGDIIGGNAGWFKASYIENAVTSNAVLAPLANKSQKDIRLFIRLAETGERQSDGFEASYAQQEVEEILSVMKKMIALREVILTVNQEYIRSAAQSDEFRTEPAFKLQGSYRNMNRLAEKLVPIMNDDEVQAMILDHYRSESQTLTTGAEANLLKFKELVGRLTEAEAARWDEIKKTFKRNQLAHGFGDSDPVGRVVVQLSAFQSGLEAIQQTLATRLEESRAPLTLDLAPIAATLESLRTTLAERIAASAAPAAPPAPAASAAAEQAGVTAQLAESLDALRQDLSRAITDVHSGTMAEKVNSLSHEMEMLHSTLATLKDLAGRQRDHLRNAQELLAERARQGTVEIQLTEEMLSNERAFLDEFHKMLDERTQAANQPPATAEPEPTQPPPLPKGKKGKDRKGGKE